MYTSVLFGHKICIFRNYGYFCGRIIDYTESVSLFSAHERRKLAITTF